MKIAQQLCAFLSKNGYLLLPGIGKFEMNSDQQGHGKYLFTPDIKTETDENLIRFFCSDHETESSVAVSDLKCFCYSIRELIIQGFEAELPGIGFLYIGTDKELKFSRYSQYHSAHQKTRKKSPVFMTGAFWI